jgi:hypothetical protein
MTGGYKPKGGQEGALADFDRPNLTTETRHRIDSATISLAAETTPAIKRTKLVRSASAPIEAEPVPDFEEMADQIRDKYEFAIDFDHRTVHALADTRAFLTAARRWPVEFRALSKGRGIKRGRLETMVIRWFRSDTDIGRTNVNRWADALMWMMDHCPAESASAAVAAAERVGGLTHIADLWRAAEKAKARNAAAVEEPPNLVAEADAIIEGLEPDRIEPIPADYQPSFEHDEENSVGVSVWRKRPGCPREYYEIDLNEKLIRRALKELRQCR